MTPDAWAMGSFTRLAKREFSDGWLCLPRDAQAWQVRLASISSNRNTRVGGSSR